MQSLPKSKALTWRTITVLIVSLIMFVLAGPIVRLICLSVALNFSLSASTLNDILLAEVPLRIAMYLAFGGLFAYTFISHRKIEGKRLIKPLLTASTILLVFFMVSSILSAPLVKAETTAVTGYYLARPIPGADWYLGKLSDGTYYAINGSNWNDLTAVEPWQASPPWASYASNYTSLTQQALASVTYGEVYMKEVPFNYNLTIPANVQVVDNVNGLTRTFINSANSQGSPYTISVDSVNAGYYLAQDGANRYVNGWTSTNQASVFTSVFATNPSHVYVGAMSVAGDPLTVPAGTWLECDPSVTGLDFASIGNGAKISGGDFKSQFTGYQSGTCTISTNSTAYLTFKPDNSIWYFSNNASYVIQNTLSSNMHVVFTAGVFPLSYNLTLATFHNLWIDGQATATKLVVQTLGINVFNFGNYYVGTTEQPSSSDAYNITISNILFDGNAVTSAGLPTTVNNGFFVEGGTGISVISCTFQYFSNHAIVLSEQGNCTGFNINNCYFYKNNLYEVAFAGTHGGNIVSNSVFQGGQGVQTWTGNTVQNNVFENCSGTAVWTEVGSGYNLITGNQFLSCQTAFLTTTNSNTFSNNKIDSPTGAVNTVVIESNNNLISGNTLTNEGGMYGFTFIGANFNLIEGNSISGGSGVNSYWMYTGTNNTLTGNYAYSDAVAFFDGATGTVITNNFVYSTTTPLTTDGSTISHNNILNGVWTP